MSGFQVDKALLTLLTSHPESAVLARHESPGHSRSPGESTFSRSRPNSNKCERPLSASAKPFAASAGSHPDPMASGRELIALLETGSSKDRLARLEKLIALIIESRLSDKNTDELLSGAGGAIDKWLGLKEQALAYGRVFEIYASKRGLNPKAGVFFDKACDALLEIFLSDSEAARLVVNIDEAFPAPEGGARRRDSSKLIDNYGKRLAGKNSDSQMLERIFLLTLCGCLKQPKEFDRFMASALDRIKGESDLNTQWMAIRRLAVSLEKLKICSKADLGRIIGLFNPDYPESEQAPANCRDSFMALVSLSASVLDSFQQDPDGDLGLVGILEGKAKLVGDIEALSAVAGIYLRLAPDGQVKQIEDQPEAERRGLALLREAVSHRGAATHYPVLLRRLRPYRLREGSDKVVLSKAGEEEIRSLVSTLEALLDKKKSRGVAAVEAIKELAANGYPDRALQLVGTNDPLKRWGGENYDWQVESRVGLARALHEAGEINGARRFLEALDQELMEHLQESNHGLDERLRHCERHPEAKECTEAELEDRKHKELQPAILGLMRVGSAFGELGFPRQAREIFDLAIPQYRFGAQGQEESSLFTDLVLRAKLGEQYRVALKAGERVQPFLYGLQRQFEAYKTDSRKLVDLIGKTGKYVSNSGDYWLFGDLISFAMSIPDPGYRFLALHALAGQTDAAGRDEETKRSLWALTDLIQHNSPPKDDRFARLWFKPGKIASVAVSSAQYGLAEAEELYQLASDLAAGAKATVRAEDFAEMAALYAMEEGDDNKKRALALLEKAFFAASQDPSGRAYEALIREFADFVPENPSEERQSDPTTLVYGVWMEKIRALPESAEGAQAKAQAYGTLVSTLESFYSDPDKPGMSPIPGKPVEETLRGLTQEILYLEGLHPEAFGPVKARLQKALKEINRDQPYYSGWAARLSERLSGQSDPQPVFLVEPGRGSINASSKRTITNR